MKLSIEVIIGDKTTTHAFENAEVGIGRDPGNELALAPDEQLGVSSRHARVTAEGSRVFVEDLKSLNGTWVDGSPIAGRIQIRSGQEVRLGRNGPRLRISASVPQTVAELAIPRTVAEGPGAIPLPESSEQVPVEVIPARSAVGTMTVMRMIDEALIRARESERGKLVRQTVFVQEIVKLATKESSRQLRIAMGVLVAVLLVAFAFVFQQMNQIRAESLAARAELTDTYRTGLESVRKVLSAQQGELESQKRAYDVAVSELRGEMETMVGKAGGDGRVHRLTADLEESRSRYSALAARVEAVEMKNRTASAGRAGQEAEISQMAAALQREEKRQDEITGQIADASKGAAVPVDLAKLRDLNRQILEAESASKRLETRIETVTSAHNESLASEDDRVARFGSELEQKNQTAILDRMTELEQAVSANPGTAVAPIATVKPAVLVEPIPRPDRSRVYSKPYPRANLKKRIAIGRFECLVANNPWGVSRDDVERQMRAQMTTILRDAGVFHVVERQDLTEILDEQKLARTGVITTQSAAPAGELLGAQALLLGKITKLDIKVDERKSSMNWGALISSFAGAVGSIAPTSDAASFANQLKSDPNLSTLETHSQNVDVTFTVQVDFKLIDTATGEVLLTTEGRGVGRSSASARSAGTALAKGGSAHKQGDHLGEGTRSALLDATVRIIEKMQHVPWRGSVMDRDGDRVILNGGKDAGLTAGDTFQVMSRGKELIDPESGQRRGFIEKPAGMIRIADVAENRSHAELISDQTLPFKPGDSLVYLGMTREIRPGDDPDASLPEPPKPIRYVLVRDKPVAYAGPSTGQATVALSDLAAGSPLRVRFVLAGWVKVSLPSGADAWMPESSVILKEEPPTSVAEISVRVRRAALRTSPSSKGRRIEALREGTSVSVNDKLGDWYQVKTAGGALGWISAADVVVASSSQPADGQRT